MDRRTFGKVVGAGAVSLASGNSISGNQSQPEASPSASEAAPRMRVGCQRGPVTRENLEFRVRHGVYHIDGRCPETIPGKGWDLDDSLRKRELCESYGVSLDAYHLPLHSGGIDKQPYPNIMLARSPQRDREIEIIQQMIEVAGRTGVHTLLYNTTILTVLRTDRTPGRGGSSYSTWDYEQPRRQDNALTIAGQVSCDDMFERITYLLDRILPVAEHWNVRLGNHIPDPPTPPGFRGICRWSGQDLVAALRRFANLYDSPCHGLNLCLGTCAEGLEPPHTEIYDIIRFLGRRRQIFNIHLRNIKGGKNKFQEVYPDEGDLAFFPIIRALREVDYPHMVMPDHLPRHPDDPDSRQGFAFAYGYIKGLITAAYGC